MLELRFGEDKVQKHQFGNPRAIYEVAEAMGMPYDNVKTFFHLW